MKLKKLTDAKYWKNTMFLIGLLIVVTAFGVSSVIYKVSAQTNSGQSTFNPNDKNNRGQLQAGNDYGIINVQRYMNTLPKESDKMIIDRRLIDRKDASIRIFQIYKPVPMHYHGQSDTYLYILSGRGKFQIGNEISQAGKGDLLYWKKGVYHGTPEIIEKPLVLMTFDSPSRNTSDTMWLNPEEAPDVFLEK